MQKSCTRCGDLKPLDAFPPDRRRRDGRQGRCRECTNAARRKTDRVQLAREGKQRCGRCEGVKAFDEFARSSSRSTGMRKWCRDCERIASKEWRQRTGYKTDPEITRRWLKANPAAARRIARKGTSTRRARLHRAFVEQVDPVVVYERDKGICGICGEAVDPERFDVDHVQPLALGGEHGYANVRLAHVSCNRRRPRR